MFKPDEYQLKALKTWYAPDNPLYLDPRHPLIKLAGEAGELLDLYGKDQYKPNFSWWNCKYCNEKKEWHSQFSYDWCHPFKSEHGNPPSYTPLVLDELGDWWYYLRILLWQKQMLTIELIKESEIITNKLYYKQGDLLYSLSCLSYVSNETLLDCLRFPGVEPLKLQKGDLKDCAFYFFAILEKLDYTLDQLTELNYTKLNSEPTAHGWK